MNLDNINLYGRHQRLSSIFFFTKAVEKNSYIIEPSIYIRWDYQKKSHMRYR